MTNKARVTKATQDHEATATVPDRNRPRAFAGEMALQSLFGHQATQSMPQGLVRLVGHRDPSRLAAAHRLRTPG